MADGEKRCGSDDDDDEMRAREYSKNEGESARYPSRGEERGVARLFFIESMIHSIQ
jgi:hypothetical protein